MSLFIAQGKGICFAVSFDPVFYPFLINYQWIDCAGNSPGDVQLIKIKRLGIVAGFVRPIRIVEFTDHDKPVFFHLIQEIRYPVIKRQFQQFIHLFGNLPFCQVTVAELSAGGQDMIDSGPDPLRAVFFETQT